MNRLDRIRGKLAAGEMCVGTHCSTTDVDFYEMCGLLDYDYIWIDNEHAGMTQPMIKNAIVATNAGGCSAFVRVPDHQMCNIKPVIECGPDGVIFPMVNTAAQAAQCVSICRYPPEGTRGFGPLRGMDYGCIALDEYVARMKDEPFLLMQCESAEAVANLEEIVQVPGVGAIICGPMDLSASVGKMGNYFDPEVLGMMDRIIDTCKKYGKPFGLSIGTDLKLVRYWVKRGASFVSMGTPQDYFRELSRHYVAQMRDADRS